MEFIAFGNCGPYPKADEACSSYLVTHHDRGILFDIGTGSLARLLKVMDPCTLDAICISHWHADHCSDLFALANFYEYNLEPGQKIKIYTIDSPASLLYQETKKLSCFEVFSLQAGTSITIGDIHIQTAMANHPVPTLLFSVSTSEKKWVYTADTNHFDGLISFCEYADAMVCDACLLHDDWNPQMSHLSAKLAGEIAARANVKQLFLSHLSPLINEELIFYEAFEAFSGAALIKTQKRYHL